MWDNQTIDFLLLVASMFVTTNVLLWVALTSAINDIRDAGYEPSRIRLASIVAIVNIVLSVYCGTVIADSMGLIINGY